MIKIFCSFAVIISLFLMLAAPSSAQEPKQITILYDAFGAPSTLVKDWGFAAFIEYGGRRILFDTGNDARIFEDNANQLRIDLTRLDAVIISHRHGDHTSGLNYLLEVNPDVKIYAPQEGAYFRGPLPLGFLEPQPGLPDELRYFEGKPPEPRLSGSPWETGKFEIVTETTMLQRSTPGFSRWPAVSTSFSLPRKRSSASRASSRIRSKSNASLQDIARVNSDLRYCWIDSRTASIAQGWVR